MKYKTQTFLPALVVFPLFIFISCQNNNNSKRYEVQMNSLRSHVGEEFKLSNILDSSGKNVELDFAKSDITIVDFWFNNCPPCIKEMSQFPSILSGKGKKVSIISISINQFSVWKETLKAHTGTFGFLGNNLSNWTHYVLKTNDDEKLKNPISMDRQLELEKTYDVTFFPAFFVVDKNAKILARPESAVDFINKL